MLRFLVCGKMVKNSEKAKLLKMCSFDCKKDSIYSFRRRLIIKHWFYYHGTTIFKSFVHFYMVK